ncbi:hypothetical protein HanIR_Chr15g0776641 [Helianthus annuus]|nr:hypothetical protein HanIR_Chr15g0776641 [Helianthus annuus]
MQQIVHVGCLDGIKIINCKTLMHVKLDFGGTSCEEEELFSRLWEQSRDIWNKTKDFVGGLPYYLQST